MTDISGGAWISDSTANRYKQTYLKGFLDLSYGDVTLHHGNVVLKGENRSGGSGGDLIVENGSIGIGTTTPNYDLDVNGTANVTGAMTLNSTLDLSGTIRITNSILQGNLVGGGSIIAGNDGAVLGDLLSNDKPPSNFNISTWHGVGIINELNDETTIAMNARLGDIYTKGKIGIGTTNPQYNLDVSGTISGVDFTSSTGKYISSTSNVSLGINAGISQYTYNIAIGSDYVGEAQGDSAIAIGRAAGAGTGLSGQGDSAIAIGNNCATSAQGPSAIAMGIYAGSTSQGTSAVAIGPQAGRYTQGENSVAIGSFAGINSQGVYSVAIGSSAGSSSSNNNYAVAIGAECATNGQGNLTVAIGRHSAKINQGDGATAVGTSSGFTGQGIHSVCIGNSSGRNNAGKYSALVGANAGNASTADNTTAIGAGAGQNGTSTNCVILNGKNALFPDSGTTQEGFYVNPVRGVAQGLGVGLVKYDSGTGELVYSTNTNIGIGTTSPQYNLDVNGTARVNGTLKIDTKWNIHNNGGNLMFEHYSNGNGTTVYFSNTITNASTTTLNVDGPVVLTKYLKCNNTLTYIDFNSNGEVYMAVNGNKTFTFSNFGLGYAPGGWHTGSDRRLKIDIVPLTDTLQTIMKLKPVNYRKKITGWDDDTTDDDDTVYITEDGFIAQDIQEIPELSHCVSHSKSNDILALNYNGFISHIVKAMQEQQTMIEEQQATIDALKTANIEQEDVITAILKRLADAGI